jgi:dihydroorotase
MKTDLSGPINRGTEPVALRGGRILDPSTGRDEIGDLWIENGRVSAPESFSANVDPVVIDARGMLVIPGLIDMHAHLCEPGYEHRETIRSGTRAAAAGGYTAVAVMPDTHPVVDTGELVRFIVERATGSDTRVHPIGAITKGREGEHLAEIGDMVEAGAVGLSDADRPVDNPAIMRYALEYARMFDIPVITHCEDRRLSGNGLMHEGACSTRLGLKGIPAVAEESVIARDLMLAALTGGRLHITHVSTAGGVALIREARQRGVRVTADVTPHHLVLTDAHMETYDTHLKVNPPLRTLRDVESLLEGLEDGVIDAIASDHKPVADDEKFVEFAAAPFGAIGLETTVGLVFTELVHPGKLSLATAIRAMTAGPAHALGIAGGSLRPGVSADITLIDPNASWTVNPGRFHSRSRNTPFGGKAMKGRAIQTICGGRIVRYEAC